MTFHVVFASPKGGSGRTTLVAQVAQRLSLAGRRCIAMGLDPSNDLDLRLGEAPHQWLATAMSGEHGARAGQVPLGIVHPELNASTLATQARTQESPVAHVPFGAHHLQQRRALEVMLLQDTAAFCHRIRSLIPSKCELLLIDTPAGRNLWTEAACSLADLVLIPVVADPGSIAALPAYESYIATIAPKLQPEQVLYVFNRWDPTKNLAHDILEVLRGIRPGRVLATPIFAEEALEEQFAKGLSAQPDRVSQGGADLDELSKFLLSALEVRDEQRGAATA